MDELTPPPPEPLVWIDSSRRDLKQFSAEVRSTFGYALWLAQNGDKHPDAKPLRGFGGAGVLEVIEDQAGSTYRAVYTVRFAGVVYVLHAFQKKSKSGIKTPVAELNLIRSRLKAAEELYARWHKTQATRNDKTNERRNRDRI